MRIKRRNLVWLGTLAALTGLAIFSQGLTGVASLVLLAILTGAAIFSIFDFQPTTLIESVQQKTNIGTRNSPDAREAVERAKARGSYLPKDLEVLDVGLIALRDSYDGMLMQRTRSLSLDDDGVRPYVSLQIPPLEADRYADITFEIIDGNGKVVYKHEQRMYLRDGKLDVLAEMQMPLSDSTLNIAHGNGDLRVLVDGTLAAMLGFTITPSTRDRFAGRRSDDARDRLRDRSPKPPQEDDVPISLEDLLRQNGRKE